MDPITDLFNRIKNAQAVQKRTTDIPCSKLKMRILELLKEEDFITDLKKRGRKPHQLVRVDLKYNQDKTPAMNNFKRISKPGKRIYQKAKDIRKVKDGYGMALVSTTKGLMTDKQAKKNKLGGEIMAEIW